MAKPSFSTSINGNFLDCVINKHRPLGAGSYGTVYEATYEELPCAAKILHSYLFGFDPLSRQNLKRFEQECELLSKIRHPCIVQFLGVARDPENSLPVLVMEFMEDSLTKFLERSETELPIHLQVNFSHDVALALAYLHSLGITHRDLSSNNVLLVAGTRAKVTDFGTSDFIKIRNRGRDRLTSCPGTHAYMAPECIGDDVQYSQSIDCFSFGVLVVQIITRKFPSPSSRLNKATPPRSRFNRHNPNEQLMRVIPEVERRQNHISLVDRTNPLKTIFMDCLMDAESERPSARDLCRNLTAIKEGSPLYMESIKNASGYQFSIIQQCDATRDELQSTASELQKTRSEIDDYHQNNERLLLKNHSLEKQISELSQRVGELEIELLDSGLKQRSAQSRKRFKGLSLFGDKDKEALDRSIQELRQVRTQNLSLLKKVETLQTEIAQNRQDLASKHRELRKKSDQILNLRDKMDILEVDLSIESVRSSSFEESKRELEIVVGELNEQIQDLKESTKLDQETLEICREEISQRDKFTQRSDTKSKKPKQSQVIMRIRSKKDNSEDIAHQPDRDSLSGDSEDTIGSLDAATLMKGDRYLKNERQSLSPVSSHHSKLESYAADSELLFRSAKEHSPSLDSSLHGSLNSGNHESHDHCDEKEELSDNDLYHPPTCKEAGKIVDGFDATSSELISASFESLPVPQDQESSTCDDNSTRPSPPTIPRNQVPGYDQSSIASSLLLLMIAAIKMLPPSLIASSDSLLQLTECADKHSEEPLPPLDSDPIDEQLVSAEEQHPDDSPPSTKTDELLPDQHSNESQLSVKENADELVRTKSKGCYVESQNESEITTPPRHEMVDSSTQIERSLGEECNVKQYSTGKQQQSKPQGQVDGELPVLETSSPIPKTSMQSQASQTATSQPAQLQDLNGTAPNPSQSVVTPQTQSYSAVPSGATASPSYVGTAQASNVVMTPPEHAEILSPSVSVQNQRTHNIATQTMPAQYNDGLPSTYPQTSTLPPEHLGGGRSYPQTTGGQQQRENQAKLHSPPPHQAQVQQGPLQAQSSHDPVQKPQLQTQNSPIQRPQPHIQGHSIRQQSSLERVNNVSGSGSPTTVISNFPRWPSEPYCSSLTTLHENIEQQETAYSSHNQHLAQPTQQLSSAVQHNKLQTNLDTKQSTSNHEPTLRHGCHNQNFTTDSQQINMLDKSQVAPMQNTKASFQEKDKPSGPTGQYNPAVLLPADSEMSGPTSQQQKHPNNQRASMPSIAASNNISLSQPEDVNNMQGAGSGASREIPLPQTHKTPGPSNAHMQTAPVDISKQCNMNSVPQHTPLPHPRETRGANALYEQQQDPGLTMNVQRKQHQTVSGAGQSHAGYSSPAGTNTRHPSTKSASDWQRQYSHQSSNSSEESSMSSLGNYSSPQSSFDSQMSSSGSKQHQRQDHDPRGARRHRAQSTPNAYTHSPSETGQEFPFLEAERERAQCSNLGSYPLPDQSLRQHRRAPDGSQFQRSDSAVSYPRNRSEPSLYRGRRRPYHHRRRPYRTAPQIIIVPQPYEQYYGYGDEYEDHHYRYTEQHYPVHGDPYGYDDHDEYYIDRGQELGYRKQTSVHDPRHADHHPPDRERNPEFEYRKQTSGCDPRPPDHHHYHERNPSESSNPQTRRQTSSSDESSISTDSPRGIGSSGPADTYPFVSQQRDERLIQALGKSAKAEEYSVVLIQPKYYVDDLDSPWIAIFAVCRRHPNCINALLEIIQGPRGTQYTVAHINIIFETQGKLILNIPHEEAEKQGYTISTDVVPCLIWQWEATPPPDHLDRPHADAVYPPRRTLTIYPHKDTPERRRLNVQLKLFGAKDCVRHFVLKRPICSPPVQNATRPITQIQYTQPLSPPMEQTGILQSEPDVTMFLQLVGQKIPHKWKGLGAYLGIPYNEIEKIAHCMEHTDSTRCQCLAAIFDYWKNHQITRPPTWSDLIAAVRNVDESVAKTMIDQLDLVAQTAT